MSLIENNEPPVKRKKHVADTIIDKYIEMVKSSQHLSAVLIDDIYKDIPLVNVFVGHIRNVKDISKTILILNEKLPLKDLQHLKRVKRQDVILCKAELVNTSIQEFIEIHVEELKDVFEYFKELEVPALPPKVKKQYQEAMKIWSCNFHPNVYLEKLVNNEFFSVPELARHRKYMEIVFEITKWYITICNLDLMGDIFENINTTIVVDPTVDQIVAISFDNRLRHPIQHSVMLAIDNVARTQNGGAWTGNSDDTLTGFDKEVLPYLKDKFPEMKLGHQAFSEASENSEKVGPYLCTGYFIYVLREPCFMCAMALVHARAKRVFFCLDNIEHGALKSRTKLQGVSSLNHHFEVFTGFI